MASEDQHDLKSDALHFHQQPRPGKLEIQPTKPLGNQRDLALAYSPGVAFACEVTGLGYPVRPDPARTP